MVLLSLESSARYCSAALHRGGECVSQKKITTERSASAELALAAKQVMTDAGIRPEELEAVAIAAGPGSYTGLRISSSLAKGLVTALGIRLIAVNTLLVLDRVAQREWPEESDFRYYCPMLDARRMEVYCQWLDERHQPVSPVQAEVVTTESFASKIIQGPVLFFGDGAPKCGQVIGHPNAAFRPLEPDAAALGDLAWKAWEQNDFQDADAFEPAYLKDFMAGPKKKTGHTEEKGHGIHR